jgi:hypothetical protein
LAAIGRLGQHPSDDAEGVHDVEHCARAGRQLRQVPREVSASRIFERIRRLLQLGVHHLDGTILRSEGSEDLPRASMAGKEGEHLLVAEVVGCLDDNNSKIDGPVSARSLDLLEALPDVLGD